MSNGNSDLLNSALSESNLNDSYMFRESQQPVYLTNDDIVNERLKYLEISIASLQNATYGYEEEILLLNEQVACLESQQYNRCESIEISGIPDDIPQNKLEETMVGVLRRIGVWGLQYFEIAACHRLSNIHFNENSRRVIIRFVNRKRAFECKQSRLYIRDTIWEFPDMFIHDSLCPTHKTLFEKCLDLKRSGHIKKLWTYNDIIHIKLTYNYGEWPKKIS